MVLYGTGKAAQLNGYSSGGKTGTAQKVDPRTHLYSKTMHVASFAGIAPVNNPVISVAVIIDTPKGASYYGAAVSAPVFAEVAQQVLEYLGVPHDVDIREPKPAAKPAKPAHEDDEDNEPRHQRFVRGGQRSTCGRSAARAGAAVRCAAGADACGRQPSNHTGKGNHGFAPIPRELDASSALPGVPGRGEY